MGKWEKKIDNTMKYYSFVKQKHILWWSMRQLIILSFYVHGINYQFFSYYEQLNYYEQYKLALMVLYFFLHRDFWLETFSSCKMLLFAFLWSELTIAADINRKWYFDMLSSKKYQKTMQLTTDSFDIFLQYF